MAAENVLGAVLRWTSLFAALMSLVCGIAHIESSFHSWCENTSSDCVGPWLFWNTGSGFSDFTDSDNGANSYFGPNYGKAFSVEPHSLAVRWGPLFAGILATAEHAGPFATGLPFQSTGGMAAFHLFMAFFVNFPCAGNWGIATGCLSLLVFVTSVVAMCLKLHSHHREPLTFGYVKDCFLYRLLRVCSSKSATKCLQPVMQWSSLVGAALVTLVGICHVKSQTRSWCSNADPVDYQCFGPWLFWKDGFDDLFKEALNCYQSLDHCQADLYGSMFTLDPEKLMCIWAPLFLGLFALSEHVKVLSSGRVNSPGSSFFFHLFLVLFVCFPCAGNFGILVGLCCLLPTAVAFVLMLVCTDEPVSVNLVGNAFVQSYAKLPDLHHEETQYRQLETNDKHTKTTIVTVEPH